MEKMGIFFPGSLHFCGVAKVVNERGPSEFLQGELTGR